ncbi:MAG: ATP-binding protein [Parasporobacterium sp.]|nr:ATP-binding protein [Parasporobacterium sp.]
MEKQTSQLTVKASLDCLPEVQCFIDRFLEDFGCSMKTQMLIDVAVEEIFVNIASYAYSEEPGNAQIDVSFDKNESGKDYVRITFSDAGIPFDPLENEDPDISLPAEKRAIGGLGVYMVKKSMDQVFYEYRDHLNKLTICKVLD